MEYSIDYIENMLRMYAASAETICRIRWDWIAECNAKTVLDYGSGCGFFRAWRPDSVYAMDSYDVVSGALQTGIRRKKYDLVCFYDILEHLDGFSEIKKILENTQYVAVTVPIKPDEVKLETWVHWKPQEHLVLFTEKMLLTLFKNFGFNCIKKGQPESPPRVDSWSFLFQKNK